MQATFLYFFLLTFLIFQAECRDVESFFTPCDAKDPKLNECVKEAGQKFIPQIAAGISEWDIEPIDPLTTSEISFVNSNNENHLKVDYKNIVQSGFSGILIEDAQVDLDHKVMTFKLRYPLITFLADYAAKGKFFGFELDGNGKANVTVWNAYSSFVLKFHVESDRIKRDSNILGFSFDKIYLDYSNLVVNGDEELSKSAGKFVNDNSGVIIDGFKPELERFYGKIIGKCLDGFFANVPYSILFKNV